MSAHASKKIKKAAKYDSRPIVESKYVFAVVVTTKTKGRLAKLPFVKEVIEKAIENDFGDVVFPNGTFEIARVNVYRKITNAAVLAKKKKKKKKIKSEDKSKETE